MFSDLVKMSKSENFQKRVKTYQNVRKASNDAKHDKHKSSQPQDTPLQSQRPTMSDTEEIAAAAAEEAIAETEEERSRKRKERLEQNRLSARESRKRKKQMIEELQRTVITLSRDNKELNDKNEQLRRQLMDIGTKVRT